MDRNFFRRVELAVPITDRKLKKRVIDEGLKMLLADNILAWTMDAQGNYTRRKPSGSRQMNSQNHLLRTLAASFVEQNGSGPADPS
jgi:polyphosphate kinase